ncbi:MAG: group 1 glycosyl transferase, partial [Phycisphaerales bacterium]|nr:group 1 glycosyl transferase [Phycisphaerales bacterium]
MTTDTLGGVWTYAVELAGALQAHGVHVGLATMGAELFAGQRAQIAAMENVTLFESRYKLEWMPDAWDDVRDAGGWLLDLEEQFRPEVVHLNGYAHGALPWNSPVLVVGHSCVMSWWEAVKGEPAPPEWDRYRQEVREGLHAADLVVAPSAAMLEVLQRHYGPLPNSRVIHNGRSAALFGPARKEGLILSAGRLWDEAKNVAALSRVASQLPWPVYAAGDDSPPVGRGWLPAGVRALGRLEPPALAGWLGRAAIFALPARYEPFGLSILEAALSECALVLGDIASLREIWNDAAIFVAPGDDDALRRALKYLARDPAARQEMATRAAARARRYAPALMAWSYRAAYGGLIGQAELFDSARTPNGRDAHVTMERP